MTRFRSLLRAAALLVVIGCTEGLRGVPMKGPAVTGEVVASVTPNEPGGLVILWHGQVVREKNKTPRTWTTWVAGSQEELDAVWKGAAKGRAPSVDFANYVVFAAAGPASRCVLLPIQRLDVEASGLMRLHTQATRRSADCTDRVPLARIIAVPRRVFPTTVVFLDGYAFEVPGVPFG